MTPITFNHPVQAEVTKDVPSHEYSVSLSKPGNLAITLTGLTGNADVLLKNSNHESIALFGVDQVASKNPGKVSEFFSYQDFAYPGTAEAVEMLKPGSYYVEVDLGDGAEKATFTLEVSEQFKNSTFDVGDFQDYFSYRVIAKDQKVYDFHVQEEGKYTFMAAAPDLDLIPELVLASKDGSKTYKSKLSQGMFPFSEIKEIFLPSGDYSLKVIPKEHKEVQVFVSGVSEEFSKKMMHQQMPVVPTKESSDEGLTEEPSPEVPVDHLVQ